jgi:serine/threonine-protein kinase RsbW
LLNNGFIRDESGSSEMNEEANTMDKILLTVDFPSTFRAVDGVCQEVQRILKEKGLAPSVFRLQLLLRETLNNAVLHGNKGDPQRQVTCQVVCGEEPNIVIAVEDQGEGFDWRGRLEQTMNEEAGSGRGLSIMKLYSQEMLFNEKGNKVWIKIAILKGGAHEQDNQG